MGITAKAACCLEKRPANKQGLIPIGKLHETRTKIREIFNHLHEGCIHIGLETESSKHDP